MLDCYRGESPETFFYPSQCDEGSFYVSIHQPFISLCGGGKKDNIALYKEIITNSPPGPVLMEGGVCGVYSRDTYHPW